MDEKEIVFPIITEIKYRRVRNLGNYQSETIEVTALVEDGQDARAVYDYLRVWAAHRLAEGENDNIEQKY